MKSLLLAPLAVSCALLSFSANAQFSACPQFFPDGKAPATLKKPRLRELCFDGFAVLHSGESKTPVYVVEKLNRSMLQAGKGLKRTNRFYEEARLPFADRAKLSDYRGSGFDRGHMFPAGDASSESIMAQSFSLANMVPQYPKNNSGVWAKSVEAATRKYVSRSSSDVHIYTGPVFSGVVDKIGAGNVWVPSHLFKLVYDPAANRAWAYWIENQNDAKASRPISYADLTAKLGFELIPGRTIK